MFVTLVEGDLKAPFSIATTHGCQKDATSFLWFVYLTFLAYLIKISVKQGVTSTIFWVFGMSRPGIDPQPPWPLANTPLIRPMV